MESSKEIRIWIKRSLIGPPAKSLHRPRAPDAVESNVPNRRTRGIIRCKSNDAAFPSSVLVGGAHSGSHRSEESTAGSRIVRCSLLQQDIADIRTSLSRLEVIGINPKKRQSQRSKHIGKEEMADFLSPNNDTELENRSVQSVRLSASGIGPWRRNSNRRTDGESEDDWSDDLSVHSAMPSMITTTSSVGLADVEPYEWARAWMRHETDDAVSVRLDISETNGCPTEEQVRFSPDQIGTDILLAASINERRLPPHDLVSLDHFHEPTVVECLERRFLKNHIYTNTGPVLIAVNPFEPLPNLYSDEAMEKYWTCSEESSKDKLPPHVYALADQAFRSMMRGIEMLSGRDTSKRHQFDQSILVSGESGAGKTVTTKYIMKYLAALSHRTNEAAKTGNRAYLQIRKKANDAIVPRPPRRISTNATILSGSIASSSIEMQVLQSNPILESFGNARTVRNDNSSRFGKFIQMQFTNTGRLVGTYIDTYLLESVRVVNQNPGERNYHIFYEILSGMMPSEELSLLFLDPISRPQDFMITCGGTYNRRDGVSDSDTYVDLIAAFQAMGFSEHDKTHIFSIVAAILHASNMTFTHEGADGSRLDDNNKHLAAVCSLLGVTHDSLTEALCYNTIVAQGISIRSSREIAKAEKVLHAFLKATYHALFTFVVNRINESIRMKRPQDEPGVKVSTTHGCLIGVLDIFGFESFMRNSFEQLCINYCNEVLQQQFNTFMLQREQTEYVKEGIEWDFIQYPENQPVLDLLDDKASGMFSILDDMCKAPGATDTSFAIELNKRCEKSMLFDSRNKQGSAMFAVHHYAGIVEYASEGFIEKNRNDLPKEISLLLKGSLSSFVHGLANIMETDSGLARGETDSIKPKTTRLSVSGQFRQQVIDLRHKIASTTPHYVRCIKPNKLLSPKSFDASMVAKQIQCGGVLQAISVTRDGFTMHFKHSEFVKRYMNIFRDTEASMSIGSQSHDDFLTFPGKNNLDTCRKLVEVAKKRIELACHSTNEASPELPGEPRELNNCIQLGKTKVLLKHEAFEALEHWLGKIQNASATKINALLRRFLCRTAFLSVRDDFRADLRRNGQTFEEWFRENRELYYLPRDKTDIRIPNIVRLRMEMFKKAAAGNITQPRRAEGRIISLENSAWMIVDGLWKRNPDHNWR